MDLTVLNLAVPALSADFRPSASPLFSTLGGALAVAGPLPDPLGAALLEAAREAFAQALKLTVAICAAVVLATAFMAAVLLQGVKTASEPELKPDLNAERMPYGGFKVLVDA